MSESPRIFQTVIFVFLVIVCGCIAGCTSSSEASKPSTSLVNPFNSSLVERVEVYHFHGNTQCTSCIAVGDLAEKTVNANFNDELASGHLVFAHVNYDLPENKDLATQYGVTGSSLWIGVYDTNGFHKQQDIQVGHEQTRSLLTYLKGLSPNG
jgi:thiol-disulfide isomerase/thioredoxin